MTASDRQFPPASWGFGDVREALAGGGDPNLPTYDDASTWRAIASNPLTEEYVDALLEQAERASGDPVSALPATLYADYDRTGNRARYEAAYFKRHQRLALFALAECFEREDNYLDDILDHVWAVCEQTTWLLPAHLPDAERRDGLPVPRSASDHHVALFSARTAHLLAELDHVLGERLHPALRTRIRTEVDERVLIPYEERDDFHWRQPPTGNWSAVCNASAVLSALYLVDDLDRLARLVVTAARALEQYLDSFGADGCAPEGLSYWNFGFGNYAMLADALDARTDGRLSLLSPPVLPDVARFPLRVELGPGRHVPFSDSREMDDVDPYLACWAGEELHVPALVADGRRALAAVAGPFSQRPSDSLMETLRDLYWCHRASGEVTDASPPQRHLFQDTGWWVARVDPSDANGLAVAAKAGHNDEPHNHNDCGSFVVHYRSESSVTDLGCGTYDQGYFGEKRYEYLTARSLGHSVPYVDGHEQAAGREHAAEVVDHATGNDVDRFEVELSDCYPSAASASSLRRTITLDRPAEQTTVRDVAAFDGSAADPEFESVFVSYAPVRESDDGVEIRGDRTRTRLAFDPTPDRVGIERLRDAVDVTSGDGDDADARDVWRVRAAPPVGDDGTAELRTTIVPEPFN